MTHRHHVALSNEEVRFSESNTPIQDLRRTSNNEQSLSVLFYLGLLVRLAGILDRKRVQIELHLNTMQEIGIGFEQSDPDDMAGALRPSACFVDRNVSDELSQCIYA